MLQLKNVDVFYGSFKALNDISMTVETGELVVLLGANGAGKTTLFNAISGDVPKTGRVVIAGQDVTDVKPHRMRGAGLARAYQVPQVFGGMTVRENLWIALTADKPERRRPFANAAGMARRATRVDEIAAAVGLAPKLDQLADELSHADQKVLDIGIALMLDPEVILLDEPTQGVSPEEITAIHRVVEAATERSTVLMIEHNMETVLGLSHHVTVLANGAVIADGTPEQIMQDEHVQQIYMGQTPAGRSKDTDDA